MCQRFGHRRGRFLSDPVAAVTDAINEIAAPSNGSPRERRVLRPRQHGSFRAVLANYAFLRLWIAQAVSQTANSMVDFSLLLRVGQSVDFHHVAQANTAVSFVILAFSLPAVVFGPIAGAVADRVSRRTVMVVTNIARAALVVLFLLVPPTRTTKSALV